LDVDCGGGLGDVVFGIFAAVSVFLCQVGDYILLRAI
jgi:hypothetical protein